MKSTYLYNIKENLARIPYITLFESSYNSKYKDSHAIRDKQINDHVVSFNNYYIYIFYDASKTEVNEIEQRVINLEKELISKVLEFKNAVITEVTEEDRIVERNKLLSKEKKDNA